MRAPDDRGVLGIFSELDATTHAIERLRERGFRRLTVFSPTPRHELEHALHIRRSPVRMFTLVGGMTGTAVGFGIAIWTSLAWPLVTGGKPIISIPAFVVIGFEVTVLLGALSTIAGLIINSWMSRKRGAVLYDPSFSAGSFGVHVAPGADRLEEARRLLQESGAVAIRDGREEVQRATA